MVYGDRKMHIPREPESRSNQLDGKNNHENCFSYLLILCYLNYQDVDSAWICMMSSFSVKFLSCSLSPSLILYLMTNIKALLLAKEYRKKQPKQYSTYIYSKLSWSVHDDDCNHISRALCVCLTHYAKYRC